MSSLPWMRCTAEKFLARGARAFKIFVVHPSPILTDYRAHGDGLLCHRFIWELAARGHDIAVACEDVDLKTPLPSNVKVFPLRLRVRGSKWLRRIEYAYKMRQLFNRLDRDAHFDIAHQFNPVFAGLSLGLAGTPIPVVLGPYVAHWPFTRTSRFKTLWLDVVSRLQQRFADAIVLSGPAARSRIVSERVRNGPNVFYVPYGIDTDVFEQAPFPAGDPVILYLAGLAARKGILTLLRAFDMVAAQHATVRLVVAGDGPEREEALRLAAASPFSERITFAGPVARADVPSTFATCTVYCLPSFGEPYGMSLVEAMATGRPVVATSAGGPADLVSPQGGYLVPPGEPAQLAQALLATIGDPARARRMGAYNREVISACNWPSIIDRLERIYATVATPHKDTNSSKV